jgi:hypothetical protein
MRCSELYRRNTTSVGEAMLRGAMQWFLAQLLLPEIEPVQTGRVSGSQGRILKATNAVARSLGFPEFRPVKSCWRADSTIIF